MDKMLQLFLSLLPAVFVGIIAYLFFKEHISNENKRRNYLIHKEIKKEALPIRLQAYERMALFLERIAPSKLLVRVKPLSTDKNEYETLLIATIEQEFEHNLSQQIYVTDACWVIIATAKNATIQLIRKLSMNEKTDSAIKLQEVVLTALMDKQAPSKAALAYIKKEVTELW